MSDRRPSNPDYLYERSRKAVTPDVLEERLAFFDELGVDWQYRNVPEFMFDFVAAARDPVAVVRRGVESGTIKGEVVRWCDYHNGEAYWRDLNGKWRCWDRERLHECEIGWRLSIPVSDGGSET